MIGQIVTHYRIVDTLGSGGMGVVYRAEDLRLHRPIWRVAPDGSGERAVTDLTGKRGFVGPSIAADGKWLYFTWREDVSDIWMMDVTR